MALPPPPPGFEPDPVATLAGWGAQITNGFRTKEDVGRLRRQGYTPAEDGAHNYADGLDVVPPKGMSLKALQRRAQMEIARRYPGGKAEIHGGTHVHIDLPGWGGAPGLPPPPEGFAPVTAGEVTDGDTFKLSDGRSGRLFGADAFEAGQQGRRSTGDLVPLGQQATDFMAGRVPGQPFNLTGGESYGRPIGTLGASGNDPAKAMLRHGHGLAAPEYLKGSPQFGSYMEAERLARWTRQGGHATNAETPEQFRNKSGPWKGAEPGQWGEGQAIFGDERTPFQGLRPEIAQGYLAIWNDPKSKPEDLIAYAEANGFKVDPDTVRVQYGKRFGPGDVPDSELPYAEPPRLLTDPGDETTGAFVRGLADPINMIDELGGVADTLGIGGGVGGPRETVWNSDRRFGDVLWNNIDVNRSILAHDDAEHPLARTVGQVASAVAIPALGIEGIGARAAHEVLVKGGSRWAAEQAARKAIAKRLAVVGGAEGGAIGAGGAEGGPLERLDEAALGAVAGATAAPLAGEALQIAAAAYRRLTGRVSRNAAGEQPELPDAPPAASEGVVEAAPEGVAAMRADYLPEVVSAPVRKRDYIEIDGVKVPPPPEGFAPEVPFGVTRQMSERLSPEEMANLAEEVDPLSVLPRPANMIEDLSEAQRANPGRFVELEAPDEFKHLPVRELTTKSGGKVRVRGPLDLTQSLRLMGGIKDEGGELAHLGITNEARRMDFGSNEQFLGKLIDNENGLDPDEATFRLWEEGYFPEFQDRPTPDELIDRLKLEQMGERRFHPDQWDEVANFEAVRSERYHIDQAREAGAPLVEERGHAINLDDLVANTPPVSAYDDAPRLTGKIGNINLDRLERPGDVAALIDQISRRVGGFDAAQRGRVTHEETRRLAEEMGLKPEQLLKRRQGQALNAEQAYAARAVVQRSRESVARLARKAVGGDDGDKLTFRKAWLKHVALEEQIAGATAEAGRALSQFRMAARAGDAGGEAIRAYLKGSGGKDTLEGAAEAIVDLMEDPAKASHFMREAVKPRWRDKFNELWINSLLSGPTTHAVNFVGNTLTTVLSFPELAVTVGIGKLTRSADRALFREVGSRAVGMADASVEALRRMRTAFRTGEPIDAITKVEAAHHRAIGGKAGHLIRTPTRALTASDEFWKHILASGELRQMAYRQAIEEARNGADLRARFRQLVHNPTDAMVKRAQAQARYFTFQKPLGEAGRGIQQVSNNWLGGKILLPFVRTPINILKFAGERSVFGLAMPEVRAALKAGGRQRDEAMARILLGSGLSTAAVVAAMDGRITGNGPTDPRERQSWLEDNQPYSVRIGDEWVSYQRFDPVSTLFGVAADFAEVGKWASQREADAIAADLAKSIAKNITNKTWLSGLSDAFDVLSDPERYGENWVERLAGSAAVPSLVNQATRVTDPYLRDAQNVLDAIKARVPVLSESVPTRLNVWGEPIERGDSLGPDIASPFYSKKRTSDPVKREMARLQAPVSMPQRSIMVDGMRVQLSPEQHRAYVELSGKAAKSYFDLYITTPIWRHMTDDERREEVEKQLKEFRAAAREELKERYPELAGKVPPPPRGIAKAEDEFVPPPPPPGFQAVAQ